jgi:hypothetical protein
VAVLGEREARLSAVQRLALVDAAAWWLSEPNGGEELAYALLAASCATQVTTEHVYLTLITPLSESDDMAAGDRPFQAGPHEHSSQAMRGKQIDLAAPE